MIWPLDFFGTLIPGQLNSGKIQYLPGFESLEILLNYLQKCPKMKTLKLHIWNHGGFDEANSMILKTILGSELKNVEKVHLTYRNGRLPHDAILTIKNALKKITDNMPQIKCLTLDLLVYQSSRTGFNELCTFFQEIATDKNITIVACVPKQTRQSYLLLQLTDSDVVEELKSGSGIACRGRV